MKTSVSLTRWICGTISALVFIGLMPVSAQPPVILNDPEYLALPIGSTATFSVNASSSTAPSYQWFHGVQLVVGATFSYLNVPNITPADGGDYLVVVNNSFGSVTSAPASLVILPLLPGMVDPLFNVGSGPEGVVRVVRPDPDGHVYIGGEFSRVNGVSHGRLARLNSNGNLDGTFTAGVSNASGFASVYALAVQTNHQLIVAGTFSHVNGTPRRSLARVNPNGTLDASLDATLGVASSVWAVTLQGDGKILIGGDFTNVLGASRNRIARLNSDGTLDGTFAPAGGMDNSVRAIAVQSDGQIIVGGAFTIVNGQLRSRLARLTTTGALDPAFTPSADNWVNTLALQPDGKIILGGAFASVNGLNRPYLARLDSNGVLDSFFNSTNAPNGSVTALALQPDGKILVGGGFTSLGLAFRQYFARLTSDGAPDPSFYEGAGANYWVENIALDDNGSILLGGAFGTVNGQIRPYLARVIGGEPAPFAPIFTVQPVRQETVPEGGHFGLNGKVLAFPAATYQWRLNGTNLPGENSPLLQRKNVRLAQAGNYELIANNAVGSVTSRVSVVTITPARTGPGALDIDFYSGTGPDSYVRSIAVQPDGKAVIGGWFYYVDGFYRPFIARLNVDGSFDPGFQPTLDSIVTQLGLSPSNNIGVAGYFYTANGTPKNALALFDTNGLLVPTFNPSLAQGSVVQSFAFQSNSQVIVAGYFIATNASPTFLRTNLVRLNLDGTLDAAFDPGNSAGLDIASVAIDTQRKILIAGGFESIQGAGRRGIARLNYYGDLDTSFNPGSGANGRVNALLLQPDGKILIAGAFRAFNGVPRHQIARLNSDGTLDMSFEPGPGANASISALRLQADGKILIGGGFTAVNDRSIGGIARLNHDGSLDLTFNPGAGAAGEVTSIANLPGGNLLVGGGFFFFDGVPRPHIARVFGGNPPPFAPIISGQSDDQTVQAGEDVMLLVEASGLPEPTYQWQFFGTNIPGATSWVLTLHNVRSSAVGAYTVTVSNSLNTVSSLPIAVNVIAPSRTAGSPDISFYTGYGPNDRVQALAVQPDGRIIIGGQFTDVSGFARNRIARLMHDGSLDLAFNPGAGASDRVSAVALQPDGRILVGGNFTNFNHITRNRLVRLETNGAVDLTFDSLLGPDDEVLAIALQSNGQVLIGGRFSQVNGQPRSGLARLNTNGTLDMAFTAPIFGFVEDIVVLPDGSIYIGGSLYAMVGTSYNVARLTSTGALDPTFASYGANGTVYALGLARTNRLVLGGEFYALNGFTQTRIGRLEANGSADMTFTNAGVNGTISALVVEPDDKVVIGGIFRNIGFFSPGLVPRNRLARLNANGSLDLSFGEGEGVAGGTSYIDEYGSVYEQTTVSALAREADGKILVAGDFTTVNGIARPYIARVFDREASAAVAILKGQGTVELSWDTGILQVAEQITGPWTDLPNAQSPLLYSTGGAQQFFRLKFN